MAPLSFQTFCPENKFRHRHNCNRSSLVFPSSHIFTASRWMNIDQYTKISKSWELKFSTTWKMSFCAKLGSKQKFQLICNTVCLTFEHELELPTRKSERTAAQVPDDDALVLSFWLLVLAPGSLGLQELNFPGTGLSITRGRWWSNQPSPPSIHPDFCYCQVF